MSAHPFGHPDHLVHGTCLCECPECWWDPEDDLGRCLCPPCEDPHHHHVPKALVPTDSPPDPDCRECRQPWLPLSGHLVTCRLADRLARKPRRKGLAHRVFG